MGSLVGLPSTFPAQRPRRSLKLRFYEGLFLWNQRVDQLVAILHSMEKFPFARKSALQYARAEIEGIRCEVNADLMEDLAEYELDDAGRFSKERYVYEKKREDPDDVYLQVQHREEERKKRGLPPRIGVVPYSALLAEEERVNAEQVPKKAYARKHPKPTSRAKS